MFTPISYDEIRNSLLELANSEKFLGSACFLAKEHQIIFIKNVNAEKNISLRRPDR